LRYICWSGDLPLELLLEAGAVAEIDLCFSAWIFLACRQNSAPLPRPGQYRFAIGRRWP